MDIVSEFTRRSATGNSNEELAQGRFVAARAELEYFNRRWMGG